MKSQPPITKPDEFGNKNNAPKHDSRIRATRPLNRSKKTETIDKELFLVNR